MYVLISWFVVPGTVNLLVILYIMLLSSYKVIRRITLSRGLPYPEVTQGVCLLDGLVNGVVNYLRQDAESLI